MRTHFLRDCFLVGNPGTSVGKMDNAASAEPVFCQRSLHGDIILMGIDPQVVTVLQREIKAPGGNAFSVIRYGNAVDDYIGFLITPTAIINYVVGWVRSMEEGKYANDDAIILAYMTVSSGNIFFNGLPIRIPIYPLAEISVFPHIAPCLFINGLYGGKI